MDSTQALQTAMQNAEQHERELLSFLSIPSISTSDKHRSHVRQCAQWLRDHILQIGVATAEIIETAGHPIVYAEHRADRENAPTILFYGHYDVQPVDPLELWTNDPFDPVVKDGKVFARGATDDKGQVFVHLKAIQTLLASGPLPVNIKLLIEGEEEVGSTHLAPFVKQNADKLRCDAVVVSDTAMFAPGQPSLVLGLRGLAYVQIDVQGPNRDLHSGAYGGPVVNPLNALCTIIASMHHSDGRIAIPGFYDAVRSVSDQERQEMAALGSQEDRIMRDVDVPSLGGEEGYTALEKLWIRPTLDVNGIGGGYQSDGAKTVLPSRAMAKVSMRLVPDQSAEQIVELLRKHVQSVTPPGVKVQVTDLHGANPVVVDRDNPATRAAATALEQTFGKQCVFQREGGSIPVVELFTSMLNIPVVLMGFGLSTENLHSPNEHFHLDNFHKGIEAAIRFYSLLPEYM